MLLSCKPVYIRIRQHAYVELRSFFTNNVLGSPPSHATCLASAALVMAQTPLNAVCAVTLVYNVWSVLYFNSARSGTSPARTFIVSSRSLEFAWSSSLQ